MPPRPLLRLLLAGLPLTTLGGKRLLGSTKRLPNYPFAELVEFSSTFWTTPDAMPRLTKMLAVSRAGVTAARDKGLHSALNMAAFYGNVDGVKALIAAGADVNNPDVNGHTPMHHALLSRSLPASETVQAAIIRSLLAANATVSTAKDGTTALSLAENNCGKHAKVRCDVIVRAIRDFVPPR